MLFRSGTSSTPPNAMPGESEMESRCWRRTEEWLELSCPAAALRPMATRGSAQLQPAAQGQIKFSQGCGV